MPLEALQMLLGQAASGKETRMGVLLLLLLLLLSGPVQGGVGWVEAWLLAERGVGRVS